MPNDTHWIECEPRLAQGEVALWARAFIGLARVATRGRSVNVFEAIAGNRRIAGGWLHLATRLTVSGTLPRPDAELVILRVAYNCRSRYEWIQHRALARVAGVDEGSLDRVALGPQAEGWTPRQQAMLAAADELHRDRVIGPDTWQTLREHLAPPSLIELCALVGHYEMTAMTLNSLGVQVEPPALALERRASVPSGLVWRRIARRRLGKERACSPSAA